MPDWLPLCKMGCAAGATEYDTLSSCSCNMHVMPVMGLTVVAKPVPEEVAAPEVSEVQVAQDAAPDGGGVDGQDLQMDQHRRTQSTQSNLQALQLA